jgi:hypothetical protein
VLVAVLAWKHVSLAVGIPATAAAAWVLLLIGPIVFVGCFVGICALCVKARLI